MDYTIKNSLPMLDPVTLIF